MGFDGWPTAPRRPASACDPSQRLATPTAAPTPCRRTATSGSAADHRLCSSAGFYPPSDPATGSPPRNSRADRIATIGNTHGRAAYSKSLTAFMADETNGNTNTISNRPINAMTTRVSVRVVPLRGAWLIGIHRADVTFGERSRSAARDLRRTTPPDFIASLLHRLVRARDLLRSLDRLVRLFLHGLGSYLGTHSHDFGHQTHHGLLGQLH